MGLGMRPGGLELGVRASQEIGTHSNHLNSSTLDGEIIFFPSATGNYTFLNVPPASFSWGSASSVIAEWVSGAGSSAADRFDHLPIVPSWVSPCSACGKAALPLTGSLESLLGAEGSGRGRAKEEARESDERGGRVLAQREPAGAKERRRGRW